MRKINVLEPSYTEDEVEAVSRVIRSKWWGQGPVTEQLEKEFSFLIGGYAVSMISCTAALQIAVHILKSQHPDPTNIVCPALTFISTAAAGIYEGLEVRFADIKEDFTMDPDSANRLIDDGTVAVLPVHYAGTRAEVMGYDAPVIEDCAHANGSPWAGRSSYDQDMACWSFHPVKPAGSFGLGILTTTNKDFTERARKLRWLGISQATWDRESGGYNWEYEIEELGYKADPSDGSSALALSQLRRLPQMQEKRRIIAETYNRELSGLGLILPPKSDTWHLYVIRVPNNLRNTFIDSSAIMAGGCGA